MSEVHEAAVPRLHSRLADARRERDELRDLAGRLARALEREVDARSGGPVYHRETAAALLLAQEAGLL